MDLDDDGTQRPATVKDYGVKPDFEELDEGAKEVCQLFPTVATGLIGSGWLGRGGSGARSRGHEDQERLGEAGPRYEGN
jgi:hypothetical protein